MTTNPVRPDDASHGVDANLAVHGALSYLEIPAAELLRSAAFYERVLGWQIDRSDPTRPKFSHPSGRLIGRWCAGRAPSREAGLLAYFYVDRLRDVASASRRTAAKSSEPRTRRAMCWSRPSATQRAT